jgi:GMP synthase-like glutamine amidotransferase
METGGVRVLSISHEADAGPGVFADAARARGHALDEWMLPDGDAPGDPLAYDAVMTFGGSMHADQGAEHPWLRDEKELLRELIERRVPLLGVCLGSQLVAEAAGAPAEPAPEPEIGWFAVELTPEGVSDPLLAPLAPRFTAFQWHSYRSPLPPGAVALARSPVALQAFRVGASAWGIQFHAEVTEHDALGWTERFEEDEKAVEIGLDPNALTAAIRERIGPWNQLGRDLCGRFLRLASEPR